MKAAFIVLLTIVLVFCSKGLASKPLDWDFLATHLLNIKEGTLNRHLEAQEYVLAQNACRLQLKHKRLPIECYKMMRIQPMQNTSQIVLLKGALAKNCKKAAQSLSSDEFAPKVKDLKELPVECQEEVEKRLLILRYQQNEEVQAMLGL